MAASATSGGGFIAFLLNKFFKKTTIDDRKRKT